MRIGLDEIAKSFGEREVFRDVSWQIHAGERWALLGPNGAGKTTLLKVLSGGESIDRGKVRRARGLGISSVAQGDLASVQTGAREFLLGAFEKILRMRRRLAALHEAAAAGDASEKILSEMADLQDWLEVHGGYTIESRVEKVLTGLGFRPEKWTMPCRTFSGGEQMRLKLGRVILEPSGLLLLDEPGNHLDNLQRDFLAQFLAESREAMVIVTHDARLLEGVVDHVAYLFDRRLFTFRGDFRAFQRQLDELRRSREKNFQAQQAFIRSTEAFIRRYKAGQRTKQARGREKVLARMERVEAPLSRESAFRFRLDCRERSGKRVLETEDLRIKAGELCLDARGLALLRGDRIALVGPNGCGKTSLLKVLAGGAEPASGSVSWGSRVTVSLFDQHQQALDVRDTLFDALGKCMPGAMRQDIMDRLGAFGFGSERADEKVGTLSGGERSRLHLLAVLVSGANVLLLDEPTNHLDQAMKGALAAALSDYEGTLVVVSHEQSFLEQVAERSWVIRDGAVVQETDLVLSAPLPGRTGSAPGAGGNDVRRNREAWRLSKNERFRLNRELSSIESQVGVLSREIGELQERFSVPDGLSPEDFAALSEKLKRKEGEKASLEEAWLALSEQLETDGGA